MPIYTWKNVKTGKTVEIVRPMKDATVPPDESGDWSLVIPAFGVGRVEGAGSSPARAAKTK